MSPINVALSQFQNASINKFIFSHCPSKVSFIPTVWSGNTLLQFIILYLHYLKNNTRRQIIQLSDNGLCALDYWVNINNKIIDDEKQSLDNEKEEKFVQFEDIHKSKYFYKYMRNLKSSTQTSISQPTNTETYNLHISPTLFTLNPSNIAIITPSNYATISPSDLPSITPTITPTDNPTNSPAIEPTYYPSNIPTMYPTNIPSMTPIKPPTIQSTIPFTYQSNVPIHSPTYQPTNSPTKSTITLTLFLQISQHIILVLHQQYYIFIIHQHIHHIYLQYYF